MRASAAARRYARALFSLARDEGRADDVRGELAALGSLLGGDATLHAAIFQPLHPRAERIGVLGSVCERLGTSAIVRRFCSFLVEQRRMIDFDGIRAAYDQLADEAAGRTRARVVSASPLSDDQRARLSRALTARTGMQVELEESVDPALLGGAVANVGGLVFDGSLRTQLEQLRTSLTRGH